MSGAAPLRFLAVVLGGWVAVRAAVLMPGWLPASEPAHAVQVEARDRPAAFVAGPRHAAPGQATWPPVATPAPSIRHASESRAFKTEGRSLATPDPGFRRDDDGAGWALALVEGTSPAGTQLSTPPLLPSTAPHRTSFPSRWSVSAWALIRRGDGRQLAPGGMLGGSQAGARITYGVSEGLLLSGRAYAPLSEPRGAEAALGIEWQPHRALPVRLLAERRQAIGRDGRTAFALLAHGGVSDQRFVGPITMDAYGQAGIVGAKSRNTFIDGAVRLGFPVADDLRIGAGAWGAAQPGAARLDIGPHLSWRLPAAADRVRLSADWRVRVAGDARPGSGPALTLATDF